MLFIAWMNWSQMKYFKEPIQQEIWRLVLTDKSDLWDTSWERVSWKWSRWPGWSKSKELEVDKGKRLWTGCHSLVGNNGRSMTYWKSIKIVMNIYWSPTSESDTALTLDWNWSPEIMRELDLSAHDDRAGFNVPRDTDHFVDEETVGGEQDAEVINRTWTERIVWLSEWIGSGFRAQRTSLEPAYSVAAYAHVTWLRAT